MSRLIVRNLPKTLEKEKLAEIFSAHGELTDVRICKKKSGESRRFGFVGFKDEIAAEKAREYFNKSYIKTSKIEVEFAKDIGDTTVPRPWSKFSSKSSQFERNLKEKTERKERIKKLQELKSPGKDDKDVNISSKQSQGKSTNFSKNDIGFDEFIKAHQKPSTKKTWTNEVFESDDATPDVSKKPSSDGTKQIDASASERRKGKSKKISEVGISANEAEVKEASSEEREDALENQNQDNAKSDLDWLGSKVSKKMDEDDSGDNDDDDSEDDDADDSEDDLEEKEHAKSDDNDNDSSDSESSSESEDELASKLKSDGLNEAGLTVKMRGIPFSCNEKQIIEFFHPLKIVDIRIPLNEKGKAKGNAYVDFEKKEDVTEAMKRDKIKMKKRYIELFRLSENDSGGREAKSPWEQKLAAADEEEEPVAESGRLFLRNLAYTCTEEEIKTLFEKYGPIAEVHLPIDRATKRITGIGFVTFLMPEHAVNAFNALDGNIFQGRFLHIMPAKAKKATQEASINEGAASSYKKERDSKTKSLSGSGHNWNTLFLGQNAVVEALAERLNTQKSKILEAEKTDSLAVRMALGETQLVAETREFLTANGVKLDVFGQVNVKRSSEVMLVKNLPHGTKPEELRNVFGKFGDLEKVLLPPSGITAIVQFVHPTEARSAFRSLAFSKFKHVPLYLEWAPSDVFSANHENEKQQPLEEDAKVELEQDQDEDDVMENSGRLIFVKNLNFNTTEGSVKELFEKCGKVADVTIARKKDPKKPESFLSMGYGFVEFKKKESADEAIKTLQHTMLNDHQLELKKSHRKEMSSNTSRKRAISKKQRTSKILVRNVPFEANKKEIKQLFAAFGELKTVRLPQKITGSGSHRGFAFVDYLSKQDAKRAFKSLCQSTHLYGRRLVLEWAEDDDTVDSIRLKTAMHFSEEPSKKRTKHDLIDSLDQSPNDDAM